MVGGKRNRKQHTSLDDLGRALVRASASNDREAEAAASSPFLYARISARIAAERKQREEGENWLVLLGVAWRAVPALALVAVCALVLFLSASLGTRAPERSSVESLLASGDAELESVVFTERRVPMSSDEVLDTILREDAREGAK